MIQFVFGFLNENCAFKAIAAVAAVIPSFLLLLLLPLFTKQADNFNLVSNIHKIRTVAKKQKIRENHEWNFRYDVTTLFCCLRFSIDEIR